MQLQTIDNLLSGSGERRYLISNADGKVWCFPAENLRIAMELYQPSGVKGRLLKRFFPYLHRLSPVRNMIGTRIVNGALPEEILTVARRSFNKDRIEYSIFGGTPSVHQKITIQFFSGKKILGYGKITDDSDIAELFEHEKNLLDALHQKGIKNIPGCLYCGRLTSGKHFFLQTTEKSIASTMPEEWTALHSDFLTELSRKTATVIKFRDSDFYHTLASLEKILPPVPTEYADVISRELKNAMNQYGNEEYRFSAYHADFTPWNMFVEAGRLFVFDWEYGRATYPPMLDRYHFYIQQWIHVDHLSPEEIYQRLCAFEWYDPDMLRSYLLDMISRFVCREKGAISSHLSEMLAIWSGLLSCIK